MNRLFKNKSKLILSVIGGVVLVPTIVGFGLVSYMKHYKNPAHKQLADAGIEEKSVQVNEVTFNYAEGPSNGPALLLLHAQTLEWFTYSEVLPKLSENFHVFAVDYSGHGKTMVPENYQMTANQIGSDLASFIETVIEEPAFVTGNSSGGLLTTWLAANKPDLVRAIVLEDPPLFSSEYPAVKETVANRLFTASHDALQDDGYKSNFLDYWIENGTEFFKRYAGPFSQQLVRFSVDTYRNANPDESLELPFVPATVQIMIRGLNEYDPRFGDSFYEGIWNENFDHEEALGNIEVPTLLIQADFGYLEDGTLDGAMSQEQAEQAVSLIDDVEYIKIDSGHVVNLEEPEQFISIIENFFLED